MSTVRPGLSLLVLALACSSGSGRDEGSTSNPATGDSASTGHATDGPDDLDTDSTGASVSSSSSGTGTTAGLGVCGEPDGDTSDPGGPDPYRSCAHTPCPQPGCCALFDAHTVCAPACEMDADCPGHPTAGLSCREVFDGTYCVFACDDFLDSTCPDEMVCGSDAHGRPVCMWARG